MKIYTIWEKVPDSEDMPWLVAAVDEYTIEEHNGMPEFYTKELKGDRRELIINIEEKAVRNLFAVPQTAGKVATTEPTVREHGECGVAHPAKALGFICTAAKGHSGQHRSGESSCSAFWDREDGS